MDQKKRSKIASVSFLRTCVNRQGLRPSDSERLNVILTTHIFQNQKVKDSIALLEKYYKEITYEEFEDSEGSNVLLGGLGQCNDLAIWISLKPDEFKLETWDEIRKEEWQLKSYTYFKEVDWIGYPHHTTGGYDSMCGAVITFKFSNRIIELVENGEIIKAKHFPELRRTLQKALPEPKHPSGFIGA